MHFSMLALCGCKMDVLCKRHFRMRFHGWEWAFFKIKWHLSSRVQETTFSSNTGNSRDRWLWTVTSDCVPRPQRANTQDGRGSIFPSRPHLHIDIYVHRYTHICTLCRTNSCSDTHNTRVHYDHVNICFNTEMYWNSFELNTIVKFVPACNNTSLTV